MSPENSVMQQFEAFAKILKPELSTAEQLQVVAAVVDLLRTPLPFDAAAAVAQLLLELPVIPWENLKFSISKALQDAKYVTLVQSAGVSAVKTPAVLLQAVVVLLDFLQGGAEVSEDIFAAIVASAAEAAVELLPAEPIKTPELFSESLMRRVVKMRDVDAQGFLELQITPVLFKGQLSSNKDEPRQGVLLPDTRGVQFTSLAGQEHILLETGEYLSTTKQSFLIDLVRPVGVTHFPPTLAALMTVATPVLVAYGHLEKSVGDQLASCPLAAIIGPHKPVTASAAAMAAVEQVFSIGRDSLNMGATGPSGATARFPVPGTDLTVVIDARFSARGPYATSRLVREQDSVDVVIMRNDVLRLFTARGIYLFPTETGGLISLTAFF